jgi:hypothetical protein
VTIFHNPNANHPLSHDFFDGAMQVYRLGEDIVADGSTLSAYISRTLTFLFDDETFTPVDIDASGVGSLLEIEFEELEPQRAPHAFLVCREVAWFATKNRKLLGVVFEDRQDKDYGWAILGHDLRGRFRWVAGESSISTAQTARLAVRARLVTLDADGVTVFPQGDEEAVPDEGPT